MADTLPPAIKPKTKLVVVMAVQPKPKLISYRQHKQAWLVRQQTIVIRYGAPKEAKPPESNRLLQSYIDI